MIKIINAHPIFTENVICLSKRTGWTIEKDIDPQPNDLYVVFGAHEVAQQLLHLVNSDKKPVKFVIMNSEQNESQFTRNKYYLELMKRNVVFNFTEDDFLKKFDVRVMSTFDFEFINFELNLERIYDFTFIGSFSEKRKQILDDLQLKYPDKKFYIDMQWKNKDIQKMTEILHQSKCVLNIPFHSDSSLETHRINKALSCGCDVISFSKPNHKLYEKWVNFIDHLDYYPKCSENFMHELNELHLKEVAWMVNQIFIMKKDPFESHDKIP